MLTRLLGQCAPQIRLPGTSRSLKHYVVRTLDERGCARLGQDVGFVVNKLGRFHNASIHPIATHLLLKVPNAPLSASERRQFEGQRGIRHCCSS